MMKFEAIVLTLLAVSSKYKATATGTCVENLPDPPPDPAWSQPIPDAPIAIFCDVNGGPDQGDCFGAETTGNIITGTSGNDSIDRCVPSSGAVDHETINTGNGDDFVCIITGNNRINTGNGDDTVILQGNGFNHYNAAGGIDQVTIQSDSNFINLGAGNDIVTIENNANDNFVRGNGGEDEFTLNSGAEGNHIRGDGGNDVFTVQSYSNNNVLVGQGGNDSFEVLGNQNRVYGGIGDDTFVVSGAFNLIFGQGGSDTFDISEGASGSNNFISGGGGADIFTMKGGTQTIIGNGGNDVFNIELPDLASSSPPGGFDLTILGYQAGDRINLETTTCAPGVSGLVTITKITDSPDFWKVSIIWDDGSPEFVLAKVYGCQPTVINKPCCLCGCDAPAGGDPHFKRWNQDKRDSFHGECDLVMLSDDNFHGLGLDVHLRTTIRDWYSFIEAAAVKIGETRFEFSGAQVYMDGVLVDTNDLPLPFGPPHSGYSLVDVPHEQSHRRETRIHLSANAYVEVKSSNEFLTVQVHGTAEDLKNSVGIMGQYGTGEMYNRDGRLSEDFKNHAFAWQVIPDEDPQIFGDMREPYLPFEPCRLPTAPAAVSRRRLLQNDRKILEMASKACEGVSGDFDLCIGDVIATGDVEMAEMFKL